MKYIKAFLFCFLSIHFTFSQTSKIKVINEKPFNIGKSVEIQSRELGENRILNIYFPEGYNENDSTEYPVIYLLDGTEDEDFIHVVGLVQFYNFEWINLVPKSIVVGIANVDRKRDFTFLSALPEFQTICPTGGHSDRFINFIEKELQPFIESTYKTNEHKTIIGQSLGGLLATEILLKRPALFNKYFIISPSLWWDNGSLLNYKSEIVSENFNQPTNVYIGVGKEGLTPTKNPRVMEVDANLLFDKLNTSKSKNVHVDFDYLPLENHASIMHQALSNAFKMVYRSKP